MKLIVGLGNPELRYMTTRHNAGFWVVDQIATTYGAAYNRSSNLQADISKTTIDTHPVVLAKPVTYMNLSGRAVQAILHWYKIPVENCIIIHDDVSLPLGKLRFQQGGGAGGQHGVESIIEMLGGNKGFDRLKFGVGPDPGGDRRANYVLSSVPEEDRELREKSINLACEALLLWLRSGLKTASNKFNGMDLRPKPPEPPPRPPAIDKPFVVAKDAHDAFAAVAASMITANIFGTTQESSDSSKPDAARAMEAAKESNKKSALGDMTIVDEATVADDDDELEAPPPSEL